MVGWLRGGTRHGQGMDVLKGAYTRPKVYGSFPFVLHSTITKMYKFAHFQFYVFLDKILVYTFCLRRPELSVLLQICQILDAKSLI